MAAALGHTVRSHRGHKPSGLLNLRAQSRFLLSEWRAMFGSSTIVADAFAGVSVALVALPLCLAIATASGVSPKTGLVTAIVGGIVVAFFGGSRFQVSGPAAAMTFLVYEIVAKYGVAGLTYVTLIAGLLQIVSGVFRLGRFIQFIPRPVVAGFLSGIGLTILCTQLPVVLGFEVSHDEEGGALALLLQTARNVGKTQPATLAVGALAIAAMLIVPRISRRLPTPLIAVCAASVLPIAFGWNNVVMVGALPTGFPVPSLPRVPLDLWNELVMSALAVYLLASLESLLSVSVVDSLSKRGRSDHDQELVGQGLGNLASAVFGGIPVTGVIARSATNVHAGGRTRLSLIIHATVLLLMMFGLAPIVARIPRAALAGVLIAVAFRMIEVHMLRALWRGSRAEAVLFVVTAGTILVTDLIVGVPVGMIGAFIYVVYEMSHLNVEPIALSSQNGQSEPAAAEAIEECSAVQVLRVEGPLFFASGFHLRNMVGRLGNYRCVVIDLEKVPFLDITGAEILEEVLHLLHGQATQVILARPSSSVRARIGGLPRDLFPHLRECRMESDFACAMKLAAGDLRREDLCRSCQAVESCGGLARALGGGGNFVRIGSAATQNTPEFSGIRL